MTTTRLKELQTEIARLQEIDNQTSDRVRASYSINDEGQCIIKEDDCQRPNEDCEHESLMDCDCVTDEIEVPCSRALDIEWANNSI